MYLLFLCTYKIVVAIVSEFIGIPVPVTRFRLKVNDVVDITSSARYRDLTTLVKRAVPAPTRGRLDCCA